MILDLLATTMVGDGEASRRPRQVQVVSSGGGDVREFDTDLNRAAEPDPGQI